MMEKSSEMGPHLVLILLKSPLFPHCKVFWPQVHKPRFHLCSHCQRHDGQNWQKWGCPTLNTYSETGFFLAKSYMIRTHSQWRDLIKIPMHNQNSNERSMSIQNTNERSMSIQNTNERFMSIQNTNLKFIIPTTKSVVLKMFKIPTDPIKIPTDPIKIPTDPIKIPTDPIKIPI